MLNSINRLYIPSTPPRQCSMHRNFRIDLSKSMLRDLQAKLWSLDLYFHSLLAVCSWYWSALCLSFLWVSRLCICEEAKKYIHRE